MGVCRDLSMAMCGARRHLFRNAQVWPVGESYFALLMASIFLLYSSVA